MIIVHYIVPVVVTELVIDLLIAHKVGVNEKLHRLLFGVGVLVTRGQQCGRDNWVLTDNPGQLSCPFGILCFRGENLPAFAPTFPQTTFSMSSGFAVGFIELPAWPGTLTLKASDPPAFLVGSTSFLIKTRRTATATSFPKWGYLIQTLNDEGMKK